MYVCPIASSYDVDMRGTTCHGHSCIDLNARYVLCPSCHACMRHRINSMRVYTMTWWDGCMARSTRRACRVGFVLIQCMGCIMHVPAACMELGINEGHPCTRVINMHAYAHDMIDTPNLMHAWSIILVQNNELFFFLPFCVKIPS